MARLRLATLGVLVLVGCVAPVPERVRDFHTDGVQQYAQGNYAQAAQSFEAALALLPGEIDLMYNAGNSYARAGDVARAQSLYNACLQRDPHHSGARHGVAELLWRQGQKAEAARFAEEWLTLAPDRAGPYALDGWVWHQLGDLPRAQARLQQALEKDPHDARSLVELALVYESLRRPERALVLYERALAHNPDQPDIRRRLQRLYAQGVNRPQPD